MTSPSSPDGLPSNYFLGTATGPSTFDAQIGFDTQFGTIGQVAGFKFSTLAILGQPTISIAGGPTNLAFIGVNGIADSVGPTMNPRPGGADLVPGTVTFDLKGLDQVLFATQNGPISLTKGVTFVNTGTTLPTLTIYARGGNLSIGENETFNLPGGSVNLYSDTNVNYSGSVGSSAASGAGAINLIAFGQLTIDGFLHSSGDIVATTIAGDGGRLTITDDGSVNAAGDFNATAGDTLYHNGAINVGGDARLVAANGVQVVGSITAGGNIRLRADSGDVSTDAASFLQAGGIITANADTGNLTLNGVVGPNYDNPNALLPTTANLSAGANLTLNGDLAVSDSISVTSTGGSVTQNRGTVRANASPDGTPRPGNLTVTTTDGDVNLNDGTLQGRVVSVTTAGGNVTQSSYHSLIGTDSITIQSTAGGIDLGGYVRGGSITVRGSSIVRLAGDAFLIGGSGADVSLRSNGDLTADEGSIVGMDQGLFTAEASGKLNLNGSIGNGYTAPKFITGTASNGISVDGTIRALDASEYPTGSTGVSLTAYGSSLTINGALSVFAGSAGSIDLTASSPFDGVVAINGSVNANEGRATFTAGTSYANAPESVITGNDITIKAGTTATVNLGSYRSGSPYAQSTLNVTAQSIVGDNIGFGQNVATVNLFATGPISLSGGYATNTVRGGSLTVAPGSIFRVTNLNTTGATGTVVIGDGTSFTLDAGTNANAVGPVTLDGSPNVNLNASLAVTGPISVTSNTQTPNIGLDVDATLTVTGSVSLGAGNLGQVNAGGALTTNGVLTTTGSVALTALNTFGGFNVGNLAAATVTLRGIGGSVATTLPDATVTGQVTPYAVGQPSVFTLGRFTAGSISFASGATLATNDGGTLTLNLKGDFGVGGGGLALGYAGSADFRGVDDTTPFTGETAGKGGIFTVNTTAASTATPGAIRVQDVGTNVAPTVLATGGTLIPTTNGLTGTGGAGGTIAFNAADALIVSRGAILDASGGNYNTANGPTYTAGGATNGGAGGTVTLQAGKDLSLLGGSLTATGVAGPVTVNANGGNVLKSNSGTGGAGGTVNLTAAGVVTTQTASVNARGGDNVGSSLGGDAVGGTINVTSTASSSPTVTTINVMGSSFLADSGIATGTAYQGTGGTISFTSQDASAAPTSSPAPAIKFAGTRVQTGRAASTGTTLSTPGSRNGGKITVTSARVSGPGISVQDSSQLLALVNSGSPGTGGNITITTGGADVAVTNNSSVRSSGSNGSVTINTGGTRGSITVSNSTVSAESAAGSGGAVTLRAPTSITLTSANLSADVLKVESLGPNGTLTIGGTVASSLGGTTQLVLYAGGSNGLINFVSNTTLNSGSASGILAASTVTIANGIVVTVNGSTRLQLFANTGNYTGSGGNGSTSGAFGGNAAPLTTQPFVNAPPPAAASANPSRPGRTGSVTARPLRLATGRPAGPVNATVVKGAAFPGTGAISAPRRVPTLPSSSSSLQSRALAPTRTDRPGAAALMR